MDANKMDYKIIFIDEEETQHDAFLDYFDSVCPDVTPECLFPKSSLEEMLDLIEEKCPDAIVTDFRLNEIRININYNVSFNGIELINYVRKHLDNFPCFVITSFDDDAINNSDDVNLVYIKDILKPNKEKNNAKLTFADRIKSQIDKYRARKANARTELTKLLAKREKGIADLYDEERIIELDTLLEKSLDACDSIPERLKSLSNIDRLNSLINKVDQLIEKME